jgi:hypothetical protein
MQVSEYLSNAHSCIFIIIVITNIAASSQPSLLSTSSLLLTLLCKVKIRPRACFVVNRSRVVIALLYLHLQRSTC